MAPSFLFDFTDKSPNVTVTDIPQNALSFNIPPEEQKKLCPYPIPKLDDIVKDIERSAYQVDKRKFVSDLFECGAIAISNQVDLAQKEKREERYLQIINGYTPDLQRKLPLLSHSSSYAPAYSQKPLFYFPYRTSISNVHKIIIS